MTLPELKEPKEDRDRYIVYDLGLTPAYLLRFTDRLETDSFIAGINTLRKEGIVAVSADEGMSIAGFVFNSHQLNVLRGSRLLAVGLPTGGGPSLVTYDKKRHIATLGCLPIIAAYRGIHHETQGVWQVGKETDKTIAGYKKTPLKRIDFTEIAALNFTKPDYLPSGLSTPIKPEEMRTLTPHKAILFKIDTVRFGRNMSQRTPYEQAQLLIYNMIFLGV